MIGAVHEWLPAEITTRPDILCRLEDAVSGWSTRWFAKPFLKISGSASFRGAARQLGAESPWQIFRGGIAINCSGPNAMRIMGAAMDIDLGSIALAPADQHVLNAFEEAILADLAGELERNLDLPDRSDHQTRRVADPFCGRGGVVLTLSSVGGDGALASLAIPLDAIVPLCRSLIAPSPGRQRALATVDMAVSDDIVPVQMILGSATVSFASLKDLSVGDIIVLDTPIGPTAKIAMSAGEHLVGLGTLVQDGTSVSVVLAA